MSDDIKLFKYVLYTKGTGNAFLLSKFPPNSNNIYPKYFDMLGLLKFCINIKVVQIIF